MSACFSFDIESHDQIEVAADYVTPSQTKDEYVRRMETCTRWILEALAEAQAKATFFVVGQIAVTHPRLIRDIAAEGHEIACHSWQHRRVHRLSREEFREDFRKARSALEDAGGTAVVGYRAPTFSVTKQTAWAIDVLSEEGMLYDSSIFPVHHDRYGIADAPRVPFFARGHELRLLELPPVTYSILGKNLPAAGGGYFRLFPPAIIRAAVRQNLRDPLGLPVLYFHPWEFDPGQPRLPLSRLNRLRTYVGIRNARSRLQNLLARFGSLTMLDASSRFRETNLQEFDLTKSTSQLLRRMTA